MKLGLSILVVVAFAACGQDRGGGDASTRDDLAVAPDDLAVTDGSTASDSDLSAPDDLGSAADMALAGGDAAGGGVPDLGRCNGYTGSGAAARISADSRPLVSSPRLASDGSSTMAVWTVAGAGSPSFPQYGSGAWARMQSGSVVEHGALPVAISDTQSAKLFVFAGKFHLFVARALYVFNAGAWTLVSGFTADVIAQSGGELVGITGSQSTAKVDATLYDGTTVGAATQISSNFFGAVAGDGAGGFAVFTIETTSPRTLHMVTYDGAAWSSESTVGTQAVATLTFGSMTAAHVGSLWCLAYVNGSGSYSTTAWVQSGGTWSSSSFANNSPTVLLAANNGGFALGGIKGWAAVYAAATWTQTTLGAQSAQPVSLMPFQNGYVFSWAGGVNGYNVSIYDGANWATPTILTTNGIYGTPRMSVGGSTIATVWSEPSSPYESAMVAVYESGAWSAPTALSTSTLDDAAVLVDGSSVVTALPDIGVLDTRTRAAGTWAAASALPGPAVSGAVRATSMARAANGHALAAWTQFDGDSDHLYVAEYDGSAWAAPVEIEGRASTPHVAASGDTLAVVWQGSNTFWGAAWTGSTLSTPHATLGVLTGGNSGSIYSVAADGNSGFVAAFANGSFPDIPLWWSASSNGATWTASQQLDASGSWTLLGLVGGPAGVVEWSTMASGTVAMRQFHAGSWSAATTMNADLSSVGCRGAVGNADVLVVCANGTVDARRFSGGAWSTLTPPGMLADEGLAVASDGSDYRLDAYYAGSPVTSRVLHAGVWSTAVNDTSVSIDTHASNGGYCGTWVLTEAFQTRIARASGSGAYGTPTSLWSGNVFNQTLMVSWPGVTDAIWQTPPTANATPATYAALGL